MSEIPKKSVNSRPYLKTCELIYQLTSQRIGEKYRKWEADNPKYNTQSQFFPEDRKLIGRVLNCIRTKNNPYLITPRIQEAIIDIREDTVVFLMKLPNDYQAQKSVIDTRDILREEISNRFPYYVFSNFDRFKNWLQLEGTNFH